MTEALALVSPVRLIHLLQQLVRVPSVTGSAAESEAQHLMASLMQAAGLRTDLWQVDLDATTGDPAFPGMEVEREEAWGLVGVVGSGDGPTLAFNGHIDVVPVGDASAWSADPWSGELRGNRVVGRGACDMKAGLACQLMAATVLREAGVALAGTLQLQSVVGEEDGGLGTFATLRRGWRADAAVISEPTSLSVIPANAGALTFRVTVRGRSAHASVRDEGLDVMDTYVQVHRRLRDLEARRNASPDPLLAHRAIPYAISVGTVRMGDWPSSVPDLLVAEGRLGVQLGEDVAEARADLEATLADLGVDLVWFGGQFASGALPHGHPLLEQVTTAHLAAGGVPTDVRGAPYGSDLRLLTGAGIPTVQYGPGDVRLAHAPDESVPVDELVTATRALVLLATDVVGLG